MNYWRMQLHPSDPKSAMKYAVESVAAGLIGLDFKKDIGDMRRLTDSDVLQSGEHDFLRFARDMAAGDRVLIIVHHFPFARVTIAPDPHGAYNYVANPVPELGVWFRHFRRIDRDATRYFADRETNARDWEQYKMTDTISILTDRDSKSYKLIQNWE